MIPARAVTVNHSQSKHDPKLNSTFAVGKSRDHIRESFRLSVLLSNSTKHVSGIHNPEMAQNSTSLSLPPLARVLEYKKLPSFFSSVMSQSTH